MFENVWLGVLGVAALCGAVACGDSSDGAGDAGGDGDGDGDAQALDPADAPRAIVDRFSESAGTLMVRTPDNGLPRADEPIDFDQGEPFITTGLGPDGNTVRASRQGDGIHPYM